MAFPHLTFAQIKALSDPRRLSILRLLMASPRTLTGLGERLGEHPAWVRHHLQALQDAGLALLDHTETSGGRTEKFYRAAASALLVQAAILPDSPGFSAALLMGSHDLALEAGLADLQAQPHPPARLVTLPVGSLDGLAALRQGLCHLTACHLLDVDGDEYNLPYVRRFFPDQPMLVLTLAEREQGLLTASGNPLGLLGLEDLTARPLRFASRQRGSGTRLWLDRQLHHQRLPAESLASQPEFPTHTAVARAVQLGQADCGIALRAAALQHGLDFIPLFHERFDLVLPQANTFMPAIQALLEKVITKAFRQQAAELGGYETAHTGDQYALAV
jgi:molybdate-binding protein